MMTDVEESRDIEIAIRNRRIRQLRIELDKTYLAVAHLINFAIENGGEEALEKWDRDRPETTYFKTLREIENDIR